MSFGLGLATGLAKGVDTGLQKSMERMRDQIDETAKYGLAFKARQLEKDIAKEEDVMEALTNSVEVFGGGEAGKARAVSMLKQYGDINSFNSFVGDLKTRMRDDPESFKVDNYFGQYDGKDPIELLQASRAYVDKRKIDDKPTPTMPIRGGGLLKTIFGAGVEGRAGERVDERISTNLSAMGLTPRERVSEFPTADINFKGEQFKLDGMNAKEQVDYITSKIATLEVGSKRYVSLATQLNKVTTNLGGQSRIEELSRQYNVDPEKNKNLLPEIQELAEALRTQEILFSGDKTEIAKLNLRKAIENGDLAEIKVAQEKLVSMGGMTLKEAEENNLNRAMIASKNAKTPEEIALAEKQIKEVIEQNKKNLEIQNRLNIGPIDMSVVNDYIKVTENFVDNEILKDPEVGKYLERNSDGTLSVNTNVSGSKTATATIAAKRKKLAKEFMDRLAKTNTGVPEFDFLYNGGNVTPSNTIIAQQEASDATMAAMYEGVGETKQDDSKYPNTAEGAQQLIDAGNERNKPLTKEFVDNLTKSNQFGSEFVGVIQKEFTKQQKEFTKQQKTSNVQLFEKLEDALGKNVIDNIQLMRGTAIRTLMKDFNMTEKEAITVINEIPKIQSETYSFSSSPVGRLLTKIQGNIKPYEAPDIQRKRPDTSKQMQSALGKLSQGKASGGLMSRRQ